MKYERTTVVMHVQAGCQWLGAIFIVAVLVGCTGNHVSYAQQSAVLTDGRIHVKTSISSEEAEHVHILLTIECWVSTNADGTLSVLDQNGHEEQYADLQAVQVEQMKKARALGEVWEP